MQGEPAHNMSRFRVQLARIAWEIIVGSQTARKLNEQDARRTAAKAREQAAEKQRVPFNGFVNVTLNDTQRDAWRTWHSQGEEVDEAIQGIVDGVGKLSLSWDSRQGCFICSLFVQGDGRPDAGLILTMRGDHWYKALSRTAFVFDVICNGDLTTRQVAKSSGFNDDEF